MATTNLLMAELLTLAGLIGGTIEYCEIIKRRAGARNLERVSQASGLVGLVRVFLTEP
jgi:hypothetical protein